MLRYPDIDPVAVDFGFIKIHWYGISYVAGILLAWWLLNRRAKKQPFYGWTAAQVSDLIFYATLGIIVGGRLGSVLFYNLPYYLDNPLEIVMVNKGGMSFHGGMIGVITAIWFYSRKIHQGFFNATDFIVPVAPVGLFFGRLANFINGELWGAPSSLPWAMVFPKAGDQPRHPSQLYEALFEGLLLFLILWIFSSSRKPKMAVSGMFLLFYGIFRTSVEFVREPDANIGYLGGDWLTMGIMLSVPMVVAGAMLLIFAYQKQK